MNQQNDFENTHLEENKEKSETSAEYISNDINLKESLKNYDIDWLNYRYYIEAGDNNYLEHIISYIEDLSNIECRQNNNELISFSYNINRLEHVI